MKFPPNEVSDVFSLFFKGFDFFFKLIVFFDVAKVTLSIRGVWEMLDLRQDDLLKGVLERSVCREEIGLDFGDQIPKAYIVSGFEIFVFIGV